jgi:RNA polymerase sigma factor (sigma-70 family)
MSQMLLVKRLQHCLSAEQSDADLLAAFVAQRDHDAFAALVKRHGPLVWSICRRHLRESSAADDATQATFLMLVRQAHRVRPETLAAWLVCVARRLCRKAQLADARRRRREAAAPRPLTATTPSSELSMRELLALLDDELHNLPLRYRSALLACYWQGLTQADAAALPTLRRRPGSSRHARGAETVTRLGRHGRRQSRRIRRCCRKARRTGMTCAARKNPP